ncbi:hypothetical protein ONS95_006557 [Cadophora gregata]|uniref:uncharacterized protein n=1 Tax=Cadophora gregata TaxID=51156 RepID=UPI0026DA8456|nr:uncharacterized protein ONS95_006557 [Cadophora gregata]KAK0101382.1 hypothetical protein ONS95_006557 [Cadophora gregata]
MATQEKSSVPHIERTATEPRDNKLHPVILSQVSQINSSIRLLRLTPVEKEPIKFQPGQWVDLHIPSLPSPGGFTLTSPPSLSPNYLELAIQCSPPNATPPTPAHWIWQPPSQILNAQLKIRIGGSFTWPPPLPLPSLKRVVFIAGGVGINPLISMLSVIAEQKERAGNEGGNLDFTVRFLYSVRNSVDSEGRNEEILFLSRLREIFKTLGEEGELRLFVTGDEGGVVHGSEGLEVKRRRIDEGDLQDALSDVGNREGTVVYVCGVPEMTDRFVELAGKAEGMDERRVLSEKWW